MMEYFHKYATDRQDAVFKAMSNSSLDMSMVPTDTSFIGYMKTLFDSGKVSLDRIRTSAQRIVKVKLQLDLYNDPVPGADLANAVGDSVSQNAALETAKASLVLVKNTNNVLPLDPAKSFFFTGPSIDDIGLLCGGWTIHWQGAQGTSNFPAYGRTIQAAMSAVVGNATRAQFYQGVNIDGTWWDINLAKQKAQAADYTVIALGERTYAELLGNSDPYELPTGLTDYVKALATTGTKIILVLVEGRPRLLSGIADLAAAVLYAGLPCELGGEAISSVLFGSTNPSGKLPLTYPKSTDQVNLATPYYGRIGGNCVVGGVTTNCPVEWHFGHGLSYTSFGYSNVRLTATSLTPSLNQTVVTVTVTNAGTTTGKESVLLFVSAPGGPETRLLKKYTKVELTPGQSTDVPFTLTPDDFGKYVNEIGQGLRKEATAGTYYVSLKYDTLCNAATLGPLCKAFTWNSPSTTTPRHQSSTTKQLRHKTHASYCLDIGTTTGTKPHLWQCLASTRPDVKNQQLTLVSPSLDRVVTNTAFDRVLTAMGGATVAFQSLVASSAMQLWRLDSSQLLRSTGATNKCVDAYQPQNGGAVH
ncbi:hypothetical protein DYB30_014353, partial [Aphanomyces astaci]